MNYPAHNNCDNKQLREVILNNINHYLAQLNNINFDVSQIQFLDFKEIERNYINDLNQINYNLLCRTHNSYKSLTNDDFGITTLDTKEFYIQNTHTQEFTFIEDLFSIEMQKSIANDFFQQYIFKNISMQEHCDYIASLANLKMFGINPIYINDDIISNAIEKFKNTRLFISYLYEDFFFKEEQLLTLQYPCNNFINPFYDNQEIKQLNNKNIAYFEQKLFQKKLFNQHNKVNINKI